MSNTSNQLELAACTNNIEAAAQVAGRLAGTLYCDDRQSYDHLPFRALLTCTTDNMDDLHEVADVGLYLVCRRVIKPGVPKMVALSTMLHNPDKTHQDCDAHWRDTHGPLALQHHMHMTHYSQLSVLQSLRGPAVDGFALCGFASESDLRERFFTTPASVRVILDDIQNFADTVNSPKRLVAKVI